MLWWCNGFFGAKISLKHTAKEFQEHLKAHFRNGRVITTLAKLIADKGVLSPSKFVEAKAYTSFAKLGPDQFSTRIWHVSILDAKDHGHFALELGKEVERVDAVRCSYGGSVCTSVWSEGAAVNISGKVRDTG